MISVEEGGDVGAGVGVFLRICSEDCTLISLLGMLGQKLGQRTRADSSAGCAATAAKKGAVSEDSMDAGADPTVVTQLAEV